MGREGYTCLEMVCEKRRQRMDIANLKHFLAVLQIPVKECF